MPDAAIDRLAIIALEPGRVRNCIRLRRTIRADQNISERPAIGPSVRL
jgi:hypothetical protein